MMRHIFSSKFIRESFWHHQGIVSAVRHIFRQRWKPTKHITSNCSDEPKQNPLVLLKQNLPTTYQTSSQAVPPLRIACCYVSIIMHYVNMYCAVHKRTANTTFEPFAESAAQRCCTGRPFTSALLRIHPRACVRVLSCLCVCLPFDGLRVLKLWEATIDGAVGVCKHARMHLTCLAHFFFFALMKLDFGMMQQNA